MTFDEVISGGEALLAEAILQEMQETLQLDFKGSAGGKPGALFADGKLTKDERRAIGKALSGFSNSAGGVVVIGVDCRSIGEGPDVAQALDPIPNWKAALSAVNSAVGDLLQPKHGGIRAGGFPSTNDNSAGYLLIDVPRSERRPHMCNMARQYFKRSGSSSYAMEHFDIEDAFRRNGSPDLDLVYDFTKNMTAGRRVNASISLAVKNEGLATAKHVSLTVIERSGVRTKDGGPYGTPLTKFQRFGDSLRLIAPEAFVVNPGDTQLFEHLAIEFNFEGPVFKVGEMPIDAATFVLRYSLSAENMRPKLGSLVLGPNDFDRAARLLKPDYITMAPSR
ncbi:AlbA family DNA-binding domain-containing protein [Mesorhizobium escarrei]|uniref:AlbA_2 domain-containing protein n=1 Tax=Mesorhizobium escarrei TaxID=666018 RepID=A0ABM9DGC5_9HYPH|nr:ATP-binding protein [Mesorhizobium escarrei]CAH2394834.1 AlbA_2 domain-containing protein [Mesorhizobium escarrei]